PATAWSMRLRIRITARWWPHSTWAFWLASGRVPFHTRPPYPSYFPPGHGGVVGAAKRGRGPAPRLAPCLGCLAPASQARGESRRSTLRPSPTDGIPCSGTTYPLIHRKRSSLSDITSSPVHYSAGRG